MTKGKRFSLAVVLLVFLFCLGQTVEAVGMIKNVTSMAATELSPGAAVSPGPVLQTLMPVFRWKEPQYAKQYQFLLYADGQEAPIFDATFDDGDEDYFQTALRPGTLNADGKYRWQVKSIYNMNGKTSVSASTFSYFRTPAALRSGLSETTPLRVGGGIGFQILGGVAPYECAAETANIVKVFRQGQDPKGVHFQINALAPGTTRVMLRDSSGQQLVRTIVVQK